ncbi:hypothetical protein B0H34DRAFT_799022 [Crassisporium funariophilum]|nr:hypothetical protein B0H34DRAFT_799022 [Crassisporium funariophilum]
MSAPLSRNVGRRGTTMAVACAGAITAALGTMWVMGRDVKDKEGQVSPYEHSGKGLRGTDMAMTSSDVSAAVSGNKSSNRARTLGTAVPKDQ